MNFMNWKLIAGAFLLAVSVYALNIPGMTIGARLSIGAVALIGVLMLLRKI